MESSTVLVTGATGFVGSWLVDRLNGLGSNVHVAIRSKSDRKYLFDRDGVIIHELDISDFTNIRQVIAQIPFDFIFHLASTNINIGKDFCPLDTFDSNVKGTYNILEATRLSPKDHTRILMTSSREVYPSDPNKKNLHERKGFHPYEVSKICAELIIRSYIQTFGLDVVSIRTPNIYGGRDLNWNRIIPGTIKSILDGVDPILRSDGRNIRSFIYIQDFIDAILLVANNKNKKNQAFFNIDKIESYTALEVVRMIINVSSFGNLKPSIQDYSSHEKFELQAPTGPSVRELGWEPKVNLVTGIQKTYGWYDKHYQNENIVLSD